MWKLWRALLRPGAHWSVLALVVIEVVIGIALIVLPRVGIKLTGFAEFCVSYHSIQSVYEEYKQSTHFQSASGVRAECHDCHIPSDIPGMMKRKLEASNDTYQTFITHSIDTPEKFEIKHAELAERKWARMKEDNSAACRSCHDYDTMDHVKQRPEAMRQMKIAAKGNQSCIDCHKGVTHQLPDMSNSFHRQFDELHVRANGNDETLYSLDIKPIYATGGDKEPTGPLLPASEVKVLKRDGDWLQVETVGWTESNRRQHVLAQLPGKCILVVSIRDDIQQHMKTLEQTTAAETNTPWSKLQTATWMQKGDMVNDTKPIWTYTDSLYNGTYNQCHGAPERKHSDANGWVGTLNGMIEFTSLDKRKECALLRYLQMNASDTTGKSHGNKGESNEK